MSVFDDLNGDSQALFFAVLLFGTFVFAVGVATSLFSLTTQYFATSTDRWLAILVSGGLLVAGAGLSIQALR